MVGKEEVTDYETGLTVALDDLVTSGMIKGRLGFPNSSSVHHRMHRNGFPPPVLSLSRTSLWLWPHVVEWCERTGQEFIGPEDLASLSVITSRIGVDAGRFSSDE